MENCVGLGLLMMLLVGCQPSKQLSQEKREASSGSKQPITLKVHSPDGRTACHGYSGTSKFYKEIANEDLEGTPKWKTGDPNPPLSAHAAMVAATLYLNELVAKDIFPKHAIIDNIELCPLDTEKGNWFWRVGFQTLNAGGPISFISIAVTMDGSIVEPTITERVDLGWPLPGADDAEKTKGLTDQEIVQAFVEHLNTERRHIGEVVVVVGQLKPMPQEHPDRKSGIRFRLELEDGTRLICRPPGGWARRFNVDLRMTGQLIGLRDLTNREPGWDEIELLPGFRPRSIGLVRE